MKNQQKERLENLFRQMKANEINGGMQQLGSALIKEKGQPSTTSISRFRVMLMITLLSLFLAGFQTWRLHLKKQEGKPIVVRYVALK